MGGSSRGASLQDFQMGRLLFVNNELISEVLLPYTTYSIMEELFHKIYYTTLLMQQGFRYLYFE